MEQSLLLCLWLQLTGGGDCAHTAATPAVCRRASASAPAAHTLLQVAAPPLHGRDSPCVMTGVLTIGRGCLQ